MDILTCHLVQNHPLSYKNQPNILHYTVSVQNALKNPHTGRTLEQKDFKNYFTSVNSTQIQRMASTQQFNARIYSLESCPALSTPIYPTGQCNRNTYSTTAHKPGTPVYWIDWLSPAQHTSPHFTLQWEHQDEKSNFLFLLPWSSSSLKPQTRQKVFLREKVFSLTVNSRWNNFLIIVCVVAIISHHILKVKVVIWQTFVLNWHIYFPKSRC